MIPQEAQAITDHLSMLQSEKSKREIESKNKAQEDEIKKILGLADQNDEASRAAYEDIFRQSADLGRQEISKNAVARRGRVLDEAGATGNIRQPGFLSYLNQNIDAQEGDELARYFGNLGLERSRGILGLEEGKRNRALQAAGLIQGGQQFGQNLGLQTDIFGETKRKNTLEDIFNLASLNEAERSAKARAEAMKPGTLDYVNTAFKGLEAVGSLAGGASSAKKAFF
jgi:hypothetical protein